ncbi:hypothetical protein K2173_021218 [Erythroxylum novogranatense]|uniref:C2H2-type domain-containing protein n=1 Tax=Erythroxylum novogranatense TaxID=1862640 RepID=A0AAV8TPZ5_9ROSI|nr:hypothetical protein K2173_021218 [Erythroxylum novogranatense]
MEFWGVEVKGGQPLKVKPDQDTIIHLSQAALGEFKKDKGTEPVPLFVKFDEKKLVLGTLSSDNIPQLSFDLVFEKEFELSHNWKNGSVYFCGYQAPLPEENFSDYGDSEDEEDISLVNADNGKIEPKVENAKAAAGKAAAGKPESSTKPKANAVVPNKVKAEDGSDGSEGDSDKDDDDSDDSDGSEGDDSDEEGMSLDDDDEDEDDDESEDEETPKKVEQGKKRPNESATKTPVSSKKAKVVTPQKTDSKKGGHSATPHPAKNAGKVAKPQTPKSGGQFSCKSCDRSFGSNVALQSHTKAKHEGK